MPPASDDLPEPRSDAESPSAGSRSRRRWPGRLAIALVLFAVLCGVAFGWLLPFWGKRLLTEQIAERFGLDSEIAGLSLDPFRARVSLDGFVLRAPEDPSRVLLGFESLVVDLAPLGLFEADIPIDEIRWVAPKIDVRREADGGFDLVRLLTPSSDESSPESEPDAPLVVAIDRIAIENGSLRVTDPTGAEPIEVMLEAIDLGFVSLSTRPGASGRGGLDLRLGRGTELSWEGTLGLDPIQTEGELSVRGLDLPFVARLLGETMPLPVAGGSLGAKLRLRYDASAEDAWGVEGGRLDLAALDLRHPGNGGDLLRVDEAILEGLQIAGDGTGLGSLTAEALEVEGGILRAVLLADGRLDWATFFGSEAEPAAIAEVAIEAVVEVEASSEPVESVPDQASPPPEATAAVANASTPRIALGRLAITDLDVAYEHRTTRVPARLRLAPLALTVTGYDTGSSEPLAVALDTKVGTGGRLRVTGPVRIEPFEVGLEVVGEDLALADFGPFLSDAVQFELRGGRLSGSVRVEAGGGPTFAASGSLRAEALDAHDPVADRRFLGWKQLAIEKFSVDPENIGIENVVLEGAALDLSLDRQGRSNLARLLSSAASAAPGAEPTVGGGASSAPKIRVDRIRLGDGRVTFRDRSVKPAFSTRLEKLAGTVKGLSSESSSRADVDLAARLEEAPLIVKGRINPLAEDLYADLSIQLGGYSMPSLAPYASRFLGRGIDKGKLVLDLDYAIESRRLVAGNRVRLERFALGESAAGVSPTSLPVPLALTLLRNADGDIELDLPVRGSLDDPGFSFWNTLRQTFFNLVRKVASAPFAILGGVVDVATGLARDDPSRVLFAPGSSDLSPEERTLLGAVADALAARPNLKLDIRGRADPAVDASQEAGLAEAGGGADAASPVAEPVASEAARVSAATDAALLELARSRAEAIQAALIETGRVAPEQVFVLGAEVGPVAVEGTVASEMQLGVR